MQITATLRPPGRGRNLHLDFLRGVANFAIYLDHIPNNVMNWVTSRNYGSSDAADLFVFVAGYTAAFVYARMMVDRGWIFAATRIFKRVRQLYIAHILLLVIYMVTVGHLAGAYNVSGIVSEFNLEGLIARPVETLTQGLLLNFRPLNLDILPLYIVLMASFPPVLWIMLRKPDLVLGLSLVLYLAARHFGWNLAAFPDGNWYFNPFCWQLPFVFGAWFALGGAGEARGVIHSRPVLYGGIGYLAFSFAMTLAGLFPALGAMLPPSLLDAFNPGDKTDLTPYRVAHFVVIAFLVIRLVPETWLDLKWKIFDPVIKCGQSIAVFCVGLLLSFVAQFVLMMSSGSLLLQVAVSASGIAVMTLVAYYVSWSKREDELLLRRPASTHLP
ncbi:MAG: OpgC domain-containing protein [bacterium]|nr:OpgC domain-containing protein [bacterium]